MASTPTSSGNRWLIAFAGVIVMICLGTVYSWSLFTNAFVAGLGLTTQDATLAFELAIFFLGLGAVIGGRWQDSVGPRTVTIVGVLLWGIGVMCAGLGTEMFGSSGKWWLYLTYGIIGGLGNGMAYVTPVAMVTKWFPDKRGLGSGMVVMGFGLGAFFYNQIVSRLDIYKAAAKPAAAFVAAKAAAIKAGTNFDPAQFALPAGAFHGVMLLFTLSGVVFIVLGGLAAFMLQNPPTGYSVAGASGTPATQASGLSPNEVLRMPQLYGLWLLLFLNVTAGILIISNAVPIYAELTGAAPAVAAQVYGILAVFNGLGRFFWGAVSDRIGRNLTYTVMYLVQAIIFFLMANTGGDIAVIIYFAIVLLCYGGGFGVMPSFNADYFGTKFMGQNYGMILTAWGVAGIVGPFIAAKVRDVTGTYHGALIPVAIMLLVAAIIPFLVKKPAAQQQGA